MSQSLPTLKSIAATLHLSVGTVQRALNGKGGYSEETRQRVLREAEKCGYHVNPAASALRRNTVTLAVVLPEPVGINAPYFCQVWHGIHQAQKELKIYQVELRTVYAGANQHEDVFFRALNTLAEDGQIQGIITLTSGHPDFQACARKLEASGKRVAYLNRPDNRWHLFSSRQAGALAADIMHTAVGSRPGQYLLLAGTLDNHLLRDRSAGFMEAMARYAPDRSILEIREYHRSEKLHDTLKQLLTAVPCICGIYAVSSRETLAMCRVLQETQRKGKITAIGTDAFPALLPFFEDNTLTASIYFYPARLAYTIFYTLASELATIPVPGLALSTPAVPVFRSSASLFCSKEGIL